ncbi:nucleoside hydrolase [Maribellus comscasis]|uniref:Nucleoside hydrolase n=1 Tax=Maribellus comscasis TaxID=2681766 RepID=A0A6I6JT54_9BACT|nr:nucleoside hydrolase [Maribellus comscasis]QGY44290.1 nucleoside hydrolase [Maribellus comscasis]
MKKMFFLLFLIFPILFANGQEFPVLKETFRLQQLTPPTGKVRMILDTDTYNEVDDQFALAYTYLSKEKIDLQAVYAAPFHNGRSNGPGDGMEKSYQEILRLLKLMGKSPEGFAFRGSDNYLQDVNQPIRSDAALDLVKKAMASSPDDPLYVVPVGCITNIASAILIEPKIIKNIVVVWLGGNGLNWPHQKEFNLKQDVLAAQVVLNSGVPFVIMPCRPVVSHFHTTIPELKYYLEGKNELSDYLYNIVVEYSHGKEAWSKVIWDVTAVAWLVNSSWISTNLVHSPVLTDQVTYSVDHGRHFIRMANELNRDAIFRDLFTKIASKDLIQKR